MDYPPSPTLYSTSKESQAQRVKPSTRNERQILLHLHVCESKWVCRINFKVPLTFIVFAPAWSEFSVVHVICYTGGSVSEWVSALQPESWSRLRNQQKVSHFGRHSNFQTVENNQKSPQLQLVSCHLTSMQKIVPSRQLNFVLWLTCRWERKKKQQQQDTNRCDHSAQKS